MSSNQKKAEKVSAKMARQEKEKNPADGAGKEAGKKRRGIRPAEQQRRMSSITRKLHWYWIRRRSVRFFFADLMVFLLACLDGCGNAERGPVIVRPFYLPDAVCASILQGSDCPPVCATERTNLGNKQ